MQREDPPLLCVRRGRPVQEHPTDERQRERGRHRQAQHEGDVVAQREPAGLREYLEDGDEADDRGDQHPIEDVQTVGVACVQAMGVDDAHRRIDREIRLSTAPRTAPAALATYRVGRAEVRSTAA